MTRIVPSGACKVSLLLILAASCSTQGMHVPDAGQDPSDAGAIADATPAPVCGGLRWSGDVLIEDAEDLAELVGYNTIGGRVTIRSPSITDLDPLASLNCVTLSLIIEGNAALGNVDGLANVQDIGSVLVIRDNPALEQVDGLAGIREAPFGLVVENNAKLLTVEGLRGLGDIGGDLSVAENRSLQTLSGLRAVESVNGDVTIGHNDALTELGLSSLGSIQGELYVGHNPLLTSLNGLEALREIGTDLRILENETLADMSALDDLRSVGRFLHIWTNPSVVALDGMNSLEVGSSIYVTGAGIVSFDGFNGIEQANADLRLEGLHSLDALTGFRSLKSVGESLVIRDNLGLKTIPGLASLESVEVLFIVNNDELASITGLSSLHEVGALEIYDNEKLPNVDGLEAVQEIGGAGIGGTLLVRNNAGLRDLGGLANLSTLSSSLEIARNDALEQLGLDSLSSFMGCCFKIYDNPMLPTCEADELVAAVAAGGWDGRADVYDNDDSGVCAE